MPPLLQNFTFLGRLLRPTNRWLRWLRNLVLAVACLLVSGWLGLRLVPLPPALFRPPEPELELLDRNGRSLRAVSNDQSQYTRSVSYADLSPALLQATIAAEDQRFWNHHGVDWRANVRAAISLARRRRVVSGASTITQQLIKRGEPRPRTFSTKIKEAAQAMRLEQVWEKQRIIAEYLNRVEYGNRCLGCAEAAQFYFGKPVRQLSTAEAAFLAGLPQAPSRLNPHKNFAQARERQLWILQRMRLLGMLSVDDYRRAIDEPLRLQPPARAFEAPHFVDLVLEQLASDEPASAPDGEEPHTQLQRGRGFRTTLDLELNRFIESSLRHHLQSLSSHHVQNGAVVVIENATGNVLALVGSENYFAPGAGQVNGAWTPRSAGSTFKPFTYLLALERGDTPATVVADVPVEFPTATGIFAPVNYNRRCYGPMRYRQALANSLNISAVKVLAALGGAAALQERLQAWGLTTLTQPAEYYGLGLTIGNAEARLLELANAYACLARLGEYRPCRVLESGLHGLAAAPPPRSPRASPDACYLIADILSDNQARTLAFGINTPLRFEFPVACKTGTSSDFRDNWAFGYTPEFTVGVWAGNFDGSPMDQVSGVTGAAPILHDVFEHLHQHPGTSWYPARTNIIEKLIHPITGKLMAATNSPNSQRLCPVAAISEKFIAQRFPAEESPHDYDTQCRVRLSSEYREWFGTGDNWLAGRAVVDTNSATLRLISPLPGTIFFYDPDLPAKSQRLALKADGPPNLVWQCETLVIATGPGGTFVSLKPGQHKITALDPNTGARLETWIVVKEM